MVMNVLGFMNVAAFLFAYFEIIVDYVVNLL